jgi:hypothetical protein
MHIGAGLKMPPLFALIFFPLFSSHFFFLKKSSRFFSVFFFFIYYSFHIYIPKNMSFITLSSIFLLIFFSFPNSCFWSFFFHRGFGHASWTHFFSFKKKLLLLLFLFFSFLFPKGMWSPSFHLVNLVFSKLFSSFCDLHYVETFCFTSWRTLLNCWILIYFSNAFTYACVHKVALSWAFIKSNSF